MTVVASMLLPVSWKIISGALTIMGVLCVLWTAYEVQIGIAHSRGASAVRSEDPQGFWLLIASNALMAALFFYGAFRAWKQGQREPNF
jgi:hypothetical protein